MKKITTSLALTLLLSAAQMDATNNTFVPKYEYYPETKKPLFEHGDIRKIAIPTMTIASAAYGYSIAVGFPYFGIVGLIASTGALITATSALITAHCNSTPHDKITTCGLVSLNLLAFLLGCVIGIFVKNSSSNSKSTYTRI